MPALHTRTDVGGDGSKAPASAAGHTRGPWHIKQCTYAATADRDAAPYRIFYSLPGRPSVRLDADHNGGFTQQDAALLAAGPDMLAALEAFIVWIEMPQALRLEGIAEKKFSDAVQAAFAARSKAKAA